MRLERRWRVDLPSRSVQCNDKRDVGPGAHRGRCGSTAVNKRARCGKHARVTFWDCGRQLSTRRSIWFFSPSARETRAFATTLGCLALTRARITFDLPAQLSAHHNRAWRATILPVWAERVLPSFYLDRRLPTHGVTVSVTTTRKPPPTMCLAPVTTGCCVCAPNGNTFFRCLPDAAFWCGWCASWPIFACLLPFMYLHFLHHTYTISLSGRQTAGNAHSTLFTSCFTLPACHLAFGYLGYHALHPTILRIPADSAMGSNHIF